MATANELITGKSITRVHIHVYFNHHLPPPSARCDPGATDPATKRTGASSQEEPSYLSTCYIKIFDCILNVCVNTPSQGPGLVSMATPVRACPA